MIDFRYHLVSIISIFLALAVGIVLGAGPLQSNLGSTLGDQVTALRNEKQDLNTKLTASQQQVADAEQYETAITPLVVSGRLTGHGVVVVVLPSAESKLVDTTTTVLAEAGAKVHGVVTLSPDWLDPTKAAERSQAATTAAGQLGLSTSVSGDALLDDVLARLTVGELPVESTPERAKALATLSDAGLVDSSVPELAPGDVAILVSGDYSGTQQDVDARSLPVRSLALVLEGGSRATIVIGGAPVQAVGQAVTTDAVSAIRADPQTRAEVSTVDHARDGRGPAVVVLAVQAQLAHHVGHYGTAPDAEALLPKVGS